MVPVEIGTLQPDIFDQIPKQQFAEIRRLAKLTGAKISMHAPIIGFDPSGMDPQGHRPWDESYRVAIEKQLSGFVDRAADLTEKGEMPINFHISGMPGKRLKMGPDGKPETEFLVLVNKESGGFAPVPQKLKFNPETGKEEKEFSDEKSELNFVKKINKDQWINELQSVTYNKRIGDSMIEEGMVHMQPIAKDLKDGKLKMEDINEPGAKNALAEYQRGKVYLMNIQRNVYDMVHQAYKYCSDEEKKKVVESVNKFQEIYNKEKEDTPPEKMSEGLNIMLRTLEEVRPQIYERVEDFAKDKTAQTFANVALHGYKQFKDKAPMITVENVYQEGFAFSSGDEMASVIKSARDQFVENATKSKKDGGEGISKDEAEKLSKKLLSLTLDVGHLNLYKKAGYEDKHLLEEVKKISQYVKHLHLTDNFGYSDSHLPPGMGNVPIKEYLAELEKAGFSGTRIVEAAAIPVHFNGMSPFPYILEGMGAQVYNTPGSAYWNQSFAMQQGYFGGYGQVLPQINYESFGAGFSQLPTELGGQRQGAQGSRMSGKGLE